MQSMQSQARGQRLSLVCEQYSLEEAVLQEIPEFTVESRAAIAKVPDQHCRHRKSRSADSKR